MPSSQYEAEPDIHEAINQLVQKLNHLSFTVPTVEAERLFAMTTRLNQLNLALLIAEIRDADQEIAAATKIFNQAKKSAEQAINDIDKIADVASKIAKSVELLEKAIPVLAAVV
jgi:chromosome segregation ATPase